MLRALPDAVAFALPANLAPGGTANLSTSVSYASSWAVTSVTGPNGATGATTCDTYGRPQSTTSPDGLVTNYTYTYYPSANTQTHYAALRRLATSYQERYNTNTALLHKDYNWALDAIVNVFVSSVLTTLNPGAGNAVQTATGQTPDPNGQAPRRQRNFHLFRQIAATRRKPWGWPHNGHVSGK